MTDNIPTTLFASQAVDLVEEQESYDSLPKPLRDFLKHTNLTWSARDISQALADMQDSFGWSQAKAIARIIFDLRGLEMKEHREARTLGWVPKQDFNPKIERVR